MRINNDGHSEQLWEVGVNLLKSYGFIDSQITKEHLITHDTRSFRIDLTGIDEHRKIAVELGGCASEKLIQLGMIFDKVIHIPSVQFYEYIMGDNLLDNYKKKIDELERIIQNKKGEICKIENETENIIASIPYKRKEYDDLCDKINALISEAWDLRKMAERINKILPYEKPIRFTEEEIEKANKEFILL